MSGARPHQPWGEPARGPAELEITGGDAALAAVIGAGDRRVRFRPAAGSDLARSLGLTDHSTGGTEVSVDGLAVDAPGGPACAVNAVVLGVPPDRLRWWHRWYPAVVIVDGRVRFEGYGSTVLIANGQYLRGTDVVPRGHPGDGRLEVQVYALRGRETTAMRARLPQGDHVPHPRIRQFTGRRVEVNLGPGPWRLEVDGVPAPRAASLSVELLPGALRLLI